ncbi:hypothetical protein EZS27_016973 [termite gut metagenome]|uniref:Uncharacterized protein n=1 Tax=termite gut metagenome TaxID=433724 RepID=A0A5J4RPC7_9ZZZZ
MRIPYIRSAFSRANAKKEIIQDSYITYIQLFTKFFNYIFS